jgi:hypothetical protein
MSRCNDTKGAASAAWRRAVPLRMTGLRAALAFQARLPRAMAWLAGLVVLASALRAHGV